MATYYNTGTLPFSPAVKVKPMARVWDAFFNEWRIIARVTSRRETFNGAKYGEIIYARPESLFAHQGVRRGTCGKLYWHGRMPDSEFLALPREKDMRD